MGVDHRQDAQLLTQGELVVNEVHRLNIIWSGRLLAVFPPLRFYPPLRALVPQLQAQLIVKPAGLLHVDYPRLPPLQHVDAAVAVAHVGLCKFLDPPLNGSLVRTPGLVVVGGGVEADSPKGPPDRHAPVDAHPCDNLAQTARLQGAEHTICRRHHYVRLLHFTAV